MFISLGAYESLIRENARLAASLDWLSQTVNQLQQERSVLLERVLNIQLVAPEVTFRQEPPPPPADKLTPEMLKRMAESFIPPPAGLAKGTVFSPSAVPTSVSEAEAAMSIFEDMGDEAAMRAGVGYDPAGELRYGGR